MEAEIRSLETALEAARGYAAPCGDFARIGRYRRARQEVDARRQATGRGGRRGERSPIEAEPGRLALVRRKGAPSLAVVLRVHAIRGHRVLLDALLPHGAVVRLKSGLIKRIFWATPPLQRPARPAARRATRPPRAQGPVRPARAAAAARADGARALSRARGDADVDRVSSLPVGRHAELRSRLARDRATERAAEPAPAGARVVPRRLLAGIPERGGGARAVRRRAGASARAQGPPDRQPAPRERAAGGRGGVARGSSRTPRWPRRPPSARRCSRSRAPASR